MNTILKIKSLLLDNKTIKQTIIKNTFWLTLSEIISKSLKFSLIIYVARIIGATEYGKFSFALAFVSMLVVLSDFGLNKISTREFSRNKNKKKEFLSIITLKLLLTIIVLILTVIGSFFVTSDNNIRTIMWALMFYIAFDSFTTLIYTFLRARQQMQYEALVKILQSILITGIGFFVILKIPSIQNLSRGYLVANAIALIFLLFIFHSKILHLKFCFNISVWKKFLIMAWPVGFFTIFSTIYTQIDSVMMGFWGQITEVGWYNAAYKIVGITLIPGLIIAQSFYPAISKASLEAKKLEKLCDYRIIIAIFMAIPISLAGIILAPKLINFIYGAEFFPSIFAFQILIIMGGLLLLIRAFNEILIILDKQIKVFWIALFGAIINIILNFTLIPKYSLYGASISTLFTMIIMLIFYYTSTKKFTSIKPINKNTVLTLIISVIASIPMYISISFLSNNNVNIILIILIAGIIYLSSAFFISKLLKLKIYNQI